MSGSLRLLRDAPPVREDEDEAREARRGSQGEQQVLPLLRTVPDRPTPDRPGPDRGPEADQAAGIPENALPEGCPESLEDPAPADSAATDTSPGAVGGLQSAPPSEMAEPSPEAGSSEFYRSGGELPAEFQPPPDEDRPGRPDDPYWAELVEKEEWARGDRGLSLLVELVENGTVDPWDVDLEVVVERFMEAVDALRPEDLPTSGRLLFFASVLIRLKAQFLAGRGQELLFVPGEDQGEDWEDDGAYEMGLEYGDYSDFEDDEEAALLLSRRGPGEILVMPRQHIQKRRPITIQDLLEALENSELHERKKEEARLRRKNRREKVPFKSVKEAMDTLHQDDLVRDIEHASRLVTLAFQSQERLSFQSLEEELDRVSAFLAVLFLASRGEVDLEQEAFYGSIELLRPPPGREVTKIEPRERFKPRKKKKKKKVQAKEEGEPVPPPSEATPEQASGAGEDPGPLRIGSQEERE